MEQFIICPKDAFDDGKRYLTKGVKYKVIDLTSDQSLARIYDNDGYRVIVELNGSSHTEGIPWKLVEEE